MADQSSILPEELRALVRQAVALLGKVIEREQGAAFFQRVERVRREMAGLRRTDPDRAYPRLRRQLDEFRKLSDEERFSLAHSFGLMLELMNSCENAYRTYRLRQKKPPSLKAKPSALIYVLTAHPTEARSPENIAVFHELQLALQDALAYGFEHERQRIFHLLELAWRILTSRRRKPKVSDEAEHLYSILLREDTLDALLSVSSSIAPVYIRTWVGGDKDGHPGVDARVMRESLQLSRRRLLKFAKLHCSKVKSSLHLLGGQAAKQLLPKLLRVERLLGRLVTLRARDGEALQALRKELIGLLESYERQIGAPHPSLVRLRALLRMFPGLVVSLELRESAELVHEATRNDRLAIFKMLRELRTLAGPRANPRWYARGFVVSTTRSVDDLRAAVKLSKKALGSLEIPIVPLFEDKAALADGKKIVNQALKSPELRRALKNQWDNRFEVMVGYSDSAKEMGVLGSRVAIAEALDSLDTAIRRHGAGPLFFHGSGGSVDRGGGSLHEQTEWWPRSAFAVYKATIQGEMIERTFSSPEITRGGLEKIASLASGALSARRAPVRRDPAVRSFAEKVSGFYSAAVSDPVFLELVQKATAYRYLSVLRIGSRPSKRAAAFSLSSLRAIPWVLSWTQTRVLFPTWWGVGSAWAGLSSTEKARLKRAFDRDALFRAYVKLLGFTLAKVELAVWRIYLDESTLSSEEAKAHYEQFKKEYDRSLAFVRAMSRSNDLLWFRPWLGESITLRSPMIHPLNLLQIVALQKNDPLAIRETVTGISSGMMTTG